MSLSNLSSSRDRPPSNWPEALSTWRSFHYGDCLLDKLIEQGEKYRDPKKPALKPQDKLSYCLTDDELSETRECKRVKKFCQRVKYAEVLNPTTVNHKEKTARELVRGAWVDDKLIGRSGVIQVSSGSDLEKPLTPSGLYGYLKQSTPSSPEKTKQYGAHGRRRLVYVRDLHEKPEYIISLLFPASGLEIDALRRVLAPHILCEPNISTTISYLGQDRFIMQFDLPCYRLYFTGPEDRKETEYVKDISFLGLRPGNKTYRKRCQMSMVMSGNSFSNYTVYGLFSGVDDYPLEPPVCRSDIESEEEGGDEEDEVIYAGDHIAADEIDDSTYPTIDPREYFLRRLKIRLELCRSFWETFTDDLDMAFKLHDNPRTNNEVSVHPQGQANNSFDWENQMTMLLDDVAATLKDLCGQLQRFLERDCDQYFTGEGMWKILWAMNVDLSLNRAEESNKSRFAASFSLKVLSPLFVTLSLFSMNEDAIPFEHPKFIHVVGVFMILEVLVFLVCAVSPPMTRLVQSMIRADLGRGAAVEISSREADSHPDTSDFEIDGDHENDGDDGGEDEEGGLGRTSTLEGFETVGITDVAISV